MYSKEKSHSPANAKQVYVDGKRYRSLFEASVKSEFSFQFVSRKLKESKGAPIKTRKHTIVSETWILTHPDFLLSLILVK